MYEHYVNTRLAADRQRSMRQAADRHRLVRAARRAERPEPSGPAVTVSRWARLAVWFAHPRVRTWRVA